MIFLVEIFGPYSSKPEEPNQESVNIYVSFSEIADVLAIELQQS